jgi:ABC-type amino acid transport substrate-binding protein
MKATRFILAFALAAGTTAAFAAPAAAAEPSDPMSARTARTYAGIDIAVYNEVAKRQLESQGFPQYTD